jgi:hypothetical protein
MFEQHLLLVNSTVLKSKVSFALCIGNYRECIVHLSFMSTQNTLLTKRVLIVIPDWGLAWYIFCLEHAVRLSKEDIHVSILDLSGLNPLLYRKRFWKFVLALSQKNRLHEIKNRIAKEYSLGLIEKSFSSDSLFTLPMTKERNDVFLRAMSSKYAYVTGRSDTQIEEINEKVVELERYFFSSTVIEIKDLLNRCNFSEVITVNGRYIVNGAVVQACKESRVKCSLLEAAGSIPGNYEIYEVSPHDISSVQIMQKEFWNAAGPERDKFAEKGLQKKISGMNLPGMDFTTNFTEKFTLAQDLKSHKIAAFFPSSEREFAIFPEFSWTESFEGSQKEAFLAFCRVAKANSYRVIVRVHPVDKKSPQKLQDHFAEIENRIWQKLCEATGSEMIKCESKISSYDLISKVDLCATYASSISVECILLGKPTLILGESEISNLASEICAFNEAALIQKFKEGIPTIERRALYPYGYWLQAAGNELELFNFVSDQEVYFCNRLVNEYRVWVRPVLALKRYCKKVQIICFKKKSRNQNSLRS